MMQLLQSLFGLGQLAQVNDDPPLSELFQAETKTIHKEVEQHAFVKQILSDEIEDKHYLQHLVDLHAIYQSLESGLRANLKKISEIQSIYFEDLCRENGLQNDVKQLKEACNGGHIECSQAALDYVRHLNHLADFNPLLLVAHAYVRYLGDLSGGMILKQHLEKKWPDAIEFYDFTALLKKHGKKNSWDFKEFFKDKLNQMLLNDQQRKELGEEAKKAFELSGKLFDSALQSASSI